MLHNNSIGIQKSAISVKYIRDTPCPIYIYSEINSTVRSSKYDVAIIEPISYYYLINFSVKHSTSVINLIGYGSSDPLSARDSIPCIIIKQCSV